MSDTRSPKVNPKEDDVRRVSVAVNLLADNRSDGYGSFTLTANTATTVVTEAKVANYSTIIMTPTTANAAAELGAGTIYVSAKADGSFTLTHASNAQVDRTFDYTWSG